MNEAKTQDRLIEQLAALISRSAYVCAHDYEAKEVGTRLMAISDLKAEYKRAANLLQEILESGEREQESAPNARNIAGSFQRMVSCEQCQWAEDKDGINVVCKFPRERPPIVVDMSCEIRGRIRTGILAANYCNHFAANDQALRPRTPGLPSAPDVTE